MWKEFWDLRGIKVIEKKILQELHVVNGGVKGNQMHSDLGTLLEWSRAAKDDRALLYES